MDEGGRITLSSDEFVRLLEALDAAPVPIPEIVDMYSRPSRIPEE